VVPVTDDYGIKASAVSQRTEMSFIKTRPDAWCPLDSNLHNLVQFTIMLLVWHLVAVVTVEAADHCAFSLLTVSSLTWSQLKTDAQYLI
jgi:hypothetical protein